MTAPFSPAELAGASLAPSFPFTKGVPLLKVPATEKSPLHRSHGPAALADTETVLFDLATDPRQMQPLTDPTVAARMAAALARLHAHRVVHGDVKPRNVVRAGAPPVMALIDMDAAAALGAPVAPKSSSAFAPPELARALLAAADAETGVVPPLAASPAQDAWAFGATLFAMLTGATLLHADAVAAAALPVPMGAEEDGLTRSFSQAAGMVRTCERLEEDAAAASAQAKGQLLLKDAN
jgi:serine/threonine protein kinase